MLCTFHVPIQVYSCELLCSSCPCVTTVRILQQIRIVQQTLLWHYLAWCSVGTQIMVGYWQKNTKYIYYLKPYTNLKQMWHPPWYTVRSHNSAGDTKCRVGHNKWNEGFGIYWASHDTWFGQLYWSMNWHLSPSILLQSSVQRMPAFELWTV